MNSIANLFSSSLVQSIGWTLLHSVWQAFIIFLLIQVLLRVAGKNSSIRYKISLAGLTSILLLSISTFFYLQSKAISLYTIASEFNWKTISSSTINTNHSFSLIGFLQSNMNTIVACWILGALLFSIRVIGGGIYLSLLRKNSTMIINEWNNYTQKLANQLSLKKIIILAESASVHAPIVLGYLKPIVLLPVGMLSGLSSQQVEMILIHELMHIKRHDYLVNIGQMVMESFYFFNPFIWILSEEIRKEREHCCDDTVIKFYPDARLYAAALAQLEKVRLHRTAPAVGLVQNKNQLLNRIKRLMENSVKNYSTRGRIIPAVLLVIGLVCASWLSISKKMDVSAKDETILVQDTSIHGKEKKVSHSRTTITRTDENGESHDEVVESYDGDAALFPIPAEHDIVFPQMPALPVIPDFDVPMPPNFVFSMDSIPGALSLLEFQKFSEEFEKNFRDKFHCEPLSEVRALRPLHALEAQAIAMETHAKTMEAHAMAMAEQYEALAKLDEDLKNFEKEHGAQMMELEENFQRMEANMKAFEKELQQELLKDGYLKADEKIEHIHWNTAGEIEVNEKKIRPEHRKKYNELHDRFFDEKDLNVNLE